MTQPTRGDGCDPSVGSSTASSAPAARRRSAARHECAGGDQCCPTSGTAANDADCSPIAPLGAEFQVNRIVNYKINSVATRGPTWPRPAGDFVSCGATTRRARLQAPMAARGDGRVSTIEAILAAPTSWSEGSAPTATPTAGTLPCRPRGRRFVVVWVVKGTTTGEATTRTVAGRCSAATWEPAVGGRSS